MADSTTNLDTIVQGSGSQDAEANALFNASSPAMLYGNRPGFSVRTAKLSVGLDVVGYFGKQTGTVAYLINRKAAGAYVANLLPMRLPIDHAFGQPWVFGIRMRGVRPFPVKTGDFESDIGKTGLKYKWHRRWRTYGSRLRMVVCRILYHLWRDPIWLELNIERRLPTTKSS